jgi:RNA polymerase sigma-70 factor (ECF subfamily)
VGDGRISPHEARELEECFAAHGRDLFGYACVLARGNRAQAGELVQAAFEAAGLAWHAVRRLDGEQRRGWLRRTLADIAVSGFGGEATFPGGPPRADGRHRDPSARHAGPVEPGRPVGPGALGADGFPPDALERCWRVILQMPEPQHTVALLRWQLDMKEAEIAAVLGVAESAVGAHLQRARRRLVAQLRPGAVP